MYNKKYSFKDLTKQSFVGLDPSEFNGQGEIVGSCFYQESDQKEVADGILKPIFPLGTNAINFQRCNLDNVKLPVGSTVDGRCSVRKIQVQNDNEDWVLDSESKPTEPVDLKRFVREGKSIDPKDIPMAVIL